MTCDLRDELIEKVQETKNMCAKSRNWILSNFGDDQNLMRNSQGMRNHIFTFWFKATSLIECMFGHVKKDKDVLKRGRLYDVLESLFHFMDIRIFKIASDLKNLQLKHAFMEMNPPKDHGSKNNSHDPKQTRGSVGWRWQQQINSIASCTVQHQEGLICISHEAIAPTDKVLEPVTVVHITSLQGFLWQDSIDNVPPSCCCPEHRNGKGVCCGIMIALQNQPEFENWFQGNWFKKELLARRHRADLDPFIDIERRLKHLPEDIEDCHPEELNPKRPRKESLQASVTPSSILAKVKTLLESISTNQTLLQFVDRLVNRCCYQASIHENVSTLRRPPQTLRSLKQREQMKTRTQQQRRW
jgi:hypothetical protein